MKRSWSFCHSSPLHADATKVIGKMRIERRPLSPFGVRHVKRLERERENMLNKELHIHLR